MSARSSSAEGSTEVVRDAAYYAEVRESVGRGTPSGLLGTSSRSLDRSLERLQAAQQSVVTEAERTSSAIKVTDPNLKPGLPEERAHPPIPEFSLGDTLKVHVRVSEGSRTRVQVFEGVLIRRQGGGTRETFTVRKIAYGVGVERTFPLHSPSIEKIEVAARGRVRRTGLHYLRSLREKSASRRRSNREPRREIERGQEDPARAGSRDPSEGASEAGHGPRGSSQTR